MCGSIRAIIPALIEDGVEVLLQVDALRQAVGGNEHTQGRIAHGVDAFTAKIVGIFRVAIPLAGMIGSPISGA